MIITTLQLSCMMETIVLGGVQVWKSTQIIKIKYIPGGQDHEGDTVYYFESSALDSGISFTCSITSIFIFAK